MSNQLTNKPGYKPGKDWKGNALGRPKGSKSLANTLVEVLKEQVKLKGSDRFMNGSEAVVRVLQDMALKRDLGAIKEIFDRVDGKVTQNVQAKVTWAGVLATIHGHTNDTGTDEESSG